MKSGCTWTCDLRNYFKVNTTREKFDLELDQDEFNSILKNERSLQKKTIRQSRSCRNIRYNIRTIAINTKDIR